MNEVFMIEGGSKGVVVSGQEECVVYPCWCHSRSNISLDPDIKDL